MVILKKHANILLSVFFSWNEHVRRSRALWKTGPPNWKIYPVLLRKLYDILPAHPSNSVAGWYFISACRCCGICLSLWLQLRILCGSNALLVYSFPTDNICRLLYPLFKARYKMIKTLHYFRHSNVKEIRNQYKPANNHHIEPKWFATYNFVEKYAFLL